MRGTAARAGPATPLQRRPSRWGERRIESVANLTRADGERFMQVAADVPLKTAVRRYALEEANEALRDLRAGTLEGAAVLLP